MNAADPDHIDEVGHDPSAVAAVFHQHGGATAWSSAVVGSGGGAVDLGDLGDLGDAAFPNEALLAELDEPIDYGMVYALHTFVANLEGQVCVLKGDTLDLMDDTNSYWWLVKCIKTEEIGYIPAENIETPYERLARLNKVRNVQRTLTTAQDIEESEPSSATSSRRGITFASTNQVMTFETAEEGDGEESGVTYEYEEPMEGRDTVDAQAGSPVLTPSPAGSLEAIQPAVAGRAKSSRSSGGANFFKRMLGRRKSTDKTPQWQDAAGVQDQRPQLINERGHDLPEESQVQQAPTNLSLSVHEPINVLRIYAGNVDLKATFKTVAVNKDLTFKELLDSAIKRFRVPNASAGEYYLSVVHMDSQERTLPEDANVRELLESLQHKSLPGISADRVTRAVSTNGKVSSVLMNDDNIIRVIINRRLNMFEKSHHLIRVIMYEGGGNAPVGTNALRTYKTVAIKEDISIKDFVNMTAKKFKVDSPSDGEAGDGYVLCTVHRDRETVRREDESILSVLEEVSRLPGETEFVLQRSATSSAGGTAGAVTGAAERQALNPASFASTAVSVPSFLEELPLSPAILQQQSQMLSPSSLRESWTQQSSTPSSSLPSARPLSEQLGTPRDSFAAPNSPATPAVAPSPELLVTGGGGGAIASLPPLRPPSSTASVAVSLPPRPPSQPPTALPITEEDLLKSPQQLMDEYLVEIMAPNIDADRLEALELLIRKAAPDHLQLDDPADDFALPYRTPSSRGSTGRSTRRKNSVNSQLLGVIEDMERDLDHDLGLAAAAEAAAAASVVSSSGWAAPVYPKTARSASVSAAPGGGGGTTQPTSVAHQLQVSGLPRSRSAEVLMSAMQR
ncbi:hypothetical protein HK405_012610, partial [Cladochytrium tenue]